MSDQQGYDVIKTLTKKIGGREPQRTVQEVFRDIQILMQQAGPDGVLILEMSVHIPSRRLPA